MSEDGLSFVTRYACPACGDTDCVEVFSAPFDDGPVFEFINIYYRGRIRAKHLAGARYRLVRCKSCGLHYQADVLDPNGMEVLYEEVLSAEESLRKCEDAGMGYFRQLLQMAGQITDVVNFRGERARDVRALDFGMGWGKWALAAKAHGFTVAGTELSPTRVAYAKQNGIPVIDITTQASESYDFINAEQVFEHVAEPRPIVAELARLLRRGGVLRVNVPDSTATAKKIRDGWVVGKNELHPLEHINAYSAKSMDRLLSSAGLIPMTPLAYKRGGLQLRQVAKRVFRPDRPRLFFCRPDGGHFK